MNVEFEDWGLISYEEAWSKQTQLFNELIELKLAGKPYVNRIIICEHPHVYTLGKSGKANNMLLNEAQLESLGATLFYIDRGGDITYHGSGQLVCYPIINLDEFSLGLKAYIHKLEEVVISTCNSYGIVAGCMEGATGVWLDVNSTTTRKICAIGVRSSHFVTMHGLAFNVNTDLRYFSYINPCGFIDKGVTSLEKELNSKMNMGEVKERFKERILGSFLND